jgi:hypothetical protein
LSPWWDDISHSGWPTFFRVPQPSDSFCSERLDNASTVCRPCAKIYHR